MAWTKVPPQNHSPFLAALALRGATLFDPMGDGRVRKDKAAKDKAPTKSAAKRAATKRR